MELRFEDDPLAQSFVARIPELRARHQARGLTDDESRATIQALPRHVALHRACGGEPGGWEVEWIEMIWDGKLSELGRLQFEDHGDGVLDVHIPETGLPLEPDACDASDRRGEGGPAPPLRGENLASRRRKPVVAAAALSRLLHPAAVDPALVRAAR